MYLTPTEYNTYTERPASEATNLLIKLACKLLDSRIGNYKIYSNGYKIKELSNWYVNNTVVVTEGQKEAIKMWVASMIQEMVTSGTTPNNSKSVKLGRFSTQKGNNAGNSILPDSMGFVDSILISSGIINREIKSSLSINREVEIL